MGEVSFVVDFFADAKRTSEITDKMNTTENWQKKALSISSARSLSLVLLYHAITEKREKIIINKKIAGRKTLKAPTKGLSRFTHYLLHFQSNETHVVMDNYRPEYHLYRLRMMLDGSCANNQQVKEPPLKLRWLRTIVVDLGHTVDRDVDEQVDFLCPAQCDFLCRGACRVQASY